MFLEDVQDGALHDPVLNGSNDDGAGLLALTSLGDACLRGENEAVLAKLALDPAKSTRGIGVESFDGVPRFGGEGRQPVLPDAPPSPIEDRATPYLLVEGAILGSPVLDRDLPASLSRPLRVSPFVGGLLR
ncbi:MAG: hypothetical protein KIT00_01990 [Rhodospirillales bacterium]|nr:hypothetical protein [Rhodospirillales bacterium]